MDLWTSETLDQGIHVLAGGEGSTVVLLPGWPETAEAYGDVFPALAEHHTVLCVDPPGLGESAPSAGGYDTATISVSLDRAIRSRTNGPFHLVGHDVGAWIAYAWAAQFPDQVRSLSLLDSALPGLTPPQSFPLPAEVNVKLWQFSFNTIPELPEVLTAGRERELFDWLARHKAIHPERISTTHRERYIECYARPGAMGRGFAYYRAAAESAVQNKKYSEHKLQMPVLGLGGSGGVGDGLRKMLERLANDVDGDAIQDCGHYVMEEQPEEVARRLLKFFGRVEGRSL